jgi:GNAT superfamily N-acetyltransferase
MPYSIPLARRIQFHQSQPSSTARVFVAVAVANEDKDVDVDTWLESPLDPPQSQSHSHSHPWIAAHIDLAPYGQTQVWVFASWEYQPTTTTGNDSGNVAERKRKGLMTHLFQYIYTDLIPDMPLTPGPDWLELQRTGKYLTTPYSRSKILFGTVSDRLWAYFPDHARARTDAGYLKYIFSPDVTATIGAGSRMVDGYSFGQMGPADLQTVLDRSSIPRTLETLGQYVSVALLCQDSPVPVGWGFLGKDASISSLHTEPAHRGRGLAVALSGELLRRQGTVFGGRKEGEGDGEGAGWAHADVSEGNTASRRVMEKLGGVPMWLVMWTELDLNLLFQNPT